MSHASDTSAHDEANDVPLISPLVGEGAEAHRLVSVGAFRFTAWASDDEPRMRDVELADKLAYAQPRDIRKLIARLAKDGKLPGVHSRATVARQSTGNGASREYEVNEYWLTEAQVLFIAAKSETVEADALLREVIRVYVLARKGLLPQQSSAALASLDARFTALEGAVEQIAASQLAMVGALSKLAEAVQALATGQSHALGGGVGPSAARTIKRQLSEYGARMGDGSKADARAWRGRGEVELRGRISFFGVGRKWEALPAEKFAAARLALVEMLAMAERVSARRQGKLALVELTPRSATP